MKTKEQAQAKWAVVTGACSGIGLEIARDLADRGYSLVMVSNREPELQVAARRIAAEHGVPTHVIVMDLARPEAAAELYEKVRVLVPEVEILISNAGMFFFGEVADADPARAGAMLQLHVVTPSLLARHFGRDMRAKRSGHILFVSSASSWSDFPGIAYYGSSKRYLRSFAVALREELRPWGVNVSCLAPGAVATGLYDRTAGAAGAAARLGILRDPAGVAKAGIRGMFRGKATVLPGASARLMAVGAAITPRWLIRLVRGHTRFLPGPGD
jgi:uncharacterized protein